MGELLDEDSGEAPTCPFCEASLEDGCDHVLALLDMSFGECSGGHCYGRLGGIESRVRAAFAEALAAGNPGAVGWGDALVQELWEALESQEPVESADDVDLDSYIFLRLVADLLEEAGGERYSGPLIEDGGPGFTSSMELFYAARPVQVLEGAIADIEQRLQR